MKKQNVMPTVVLGVICLVVAILLAIVNALTAPIIEEATYQRQQASLKEVLSDASEFELKLDKPSETVLAVYLGKDGATEIGYSILLSTKSDYTSGDNMGITVGVNKAGEVVGVKLTSYTESKDFGKETYPATYVGESLSTVENHATTAGVTYSSKAFRSAIKDALQVLADNGLLEGGTK